jgi:hypothetical protein
MNSLAIADSRIELKANNSPINPHTQLEINTGPMASSRGKSELQKHEGLSSRHRHQITQIRKGNRKPEVKIIQLAPVQTKISQKTGSADLLFAGRSGH